MAILGGYDFKGDIDGWEYWYQWLLRRDPAIALKCVEGLHYGVTYEFGTAVALSSGDTELIEKFLDRCCKMNELDRCTVAFVMGRWGQCPEAFKAELNPAEAFWTKFNTWMEEYEAIWLPRVSGSGRILPKAKE